MTLFGKAVATILFLPVAVLLLYGWIRVVLYLCAALKALPLVERGKRSRYLMRLSFMDLAAAAELMPTDAGRDAHDHVTQQYRRAFWPTLLAIGSAIIATVIGFILQGIGLVVFA